jgi:hypothetical protein
MALQKEFIKDDPADKTPESKNKRLSAALVSAALLQKGIMLIERVEEGETGWTIYFHG